MRPRLFTAAVLSLVFLYGFAARPQKVAPLTPEEEQRSLHRSEEWAIVAPHLPDAKTGTPQALETAADVLRARRFPEDALDYYGYAIARGGNVTTLLNKMGIVHLELRQFDLARVMFQRVVRADKHDAQGWNNLGAVEFLTGHLPAAAMDYRRASKLDKQKAVYHSNLGLVYFQTGNMLGAHQEFGRAIQLDPEIMQRHDEGGVSAHVLATVDYPKLCFEFARMAAQSHDAETVRAWLARAAENGMEITGPLRDDPVLRAYLQDAQVQVIIANARQMHQRKVAASRPAPPLGEASSNHD